MAAKYHVTGTWIKPDECMDVNYWTKHLRQSVLFSDGLDCIFNTYPTATFLELGPGKILTNLVRKHPLNNGNTVLPLLGGKLDRDIPLFHQAIGELHAIGIDVCWKDTYDKCKAKKVNLPLYCFDKLSYWLDSKIDDVSKPKSFGGSIRVLQNGGWGTVTFNNMSS